MATGSLLSQPGTLTDRILHLSDIHWDQNYTVGLSKNCGEPICCRPPNKPGNMLANYFSIII